MFVWLLFARKCPVCGKASTQVNYPFCSPRCQDIDLNRWLSDDYRVPTNEAPESATKEDDEE